NVVTSWMVTSEKDCHGPSLQRDGHCNGIKEHRATNGAINLPMEQVTTLPPCMQWSNTMLILHKANRGIAEGVTKPMAQYPDRGVLGLL
ncbi:hypothetical protein J6590_050061, partial [Homalodisca vitripennis]